MLTLCEEVLRREGLLNSAWWLRPRQRELTTPAGNALTDLRITARQYRRVVFGTGSRLHAVARSPKDALRAAAATLRGPVRDGSCYQLAVMAEQEPSPSSRVTLGDRRDRLGQPLARVAWRLSPLDLHTIERSQELIEKALATQGFSIVGQRFGSQKPPALMGVVFIIWAQRVWV